MGLSANDQDVSVGSSSSESVTGSGDSGRGVFHRLRNRLMFVDLPINRKFMLFAFGTGFWFCFMALVGVVSMTAIHFYYHQVSENSVPYRQAIGVVQGNLHGLERELELVLHAPSYEAARAGMESARDYAKQVREEVAALGLRQGNEQRTGTIVEQILQTMAKSNPAGHEYLQRMLAISGQLDRRLDEFFLLKRDSLLNQGGQLRALSDSHALVVEQIIEAARLSDDYAGEVEAGFLAVNEQIYHIIRSSVHITLGVLVLAMALLILFVRWISVAFQQPIDSLTRQIESLESGDIERAKKVQVLSRDEIGTLSSKFNELIESVYGMTVYKKIIEEDATLDEVYRRLGEVFSEELGLGDYMIYEVNTNKKEMHPGYPPVVGEGRMFCHRDILEDCTLCRAVKTGHNISSFEYRGICRQFDGRRNQGHVCVPLMLSGKTGGVVQFVVPVDEDKPKLDSDAARRLFKAETYINQSLSVIEAKRLMNTLRDSAMVDPLTGLYNRRFLQDHSKQLISGVLRRGKQIGLLICDLDYFKQVNDNHGHDVGDQVLQELAVILKGAVRDADVVIRFGGEEFLVLLLDIEVGEAMTVAEKIRARVEQLRIKTGEAVLQKTLSIGVSEFPHDTEGFWQAIKYADVALYQAKEQGRNRALRFTPEMWTQNDF